MGRPTDPGTRNRPSILRPANLLLLSMATVFYVASWFTGERPMILLAFPLLICVFLIDLRKPIGQPQSRAVIYIALALLVYDLFAPRITGQGQPDRATVELYARIADTVWILIAGILLARERRNRDIGPRATRAVIVVVAAILGSALIFTTPEPGIDVWHLHQQAGDALVDGRNPYADIRVRSSFPADEDSAVMVGYPYTPPNLVVFGSSSVATGDSRWFSLVCWVGFLGLFGSLRPASRVGTALMLLLASQPAWHIVLEISYTESLTLVLIVGAIAAWKNRQTLGPLLLGLGLASKQYLAVLAPMLLTARILPLKSRLIVLVSAGLATAVGITWGPQKYFDAVVDFHLRVPPQEPSVNLYGVTSQFGEPILIPAAVGLIASIAIGLIAARTARTPSQLLIGTAAALGAGFFLASQAFVNYWFLVGCILALAMLLADPADSLDETARHNGDRSEVNV